jgi:hypothetical protein
MKYRVWWCLWMALAAVQTIGLWAISAMAWFTGLVQRRADAAEIEMLLARAEVAIAAQRERRARPRREGGPKP